MSKIDSLWANLLSKFLLTINLLIVSKFCEQFFADVSRKIIALADPVLSQPDMKPEMVSPPASAYIPSFTIYHVLPDLPGGEAYPHILAANGIVKIENPEDANAISTCP